MPSQTPSQATVPVSVHVLTYNSGNTLARTLQSVGPVAEILVLDGGSADDTLAIARQFRATIMDQQEGRHGPVTDFSAVRNRALIASTQPWILALDSDEELSAALREEIASIARSGTSPAAYLVPRKYISRQGEVIDYASTYPNERVYFFHRAAVTRWMKPVHERVQPIPGIPVRRLQSPCLAPLPSPGDFKRKNERYIRIEAAASRQRGWGYWIRHRLLHTLRSRAIATLRIIGIWCVPHTGKRLPLSHEWLRYWYAWRLVVDTMPSKTAGATETRPV